MNGVAEQPWGPESITDVAIINVQSLAEAGLMARANPFVTSIRMRWIAGH